MRIGMIGAAGVGKDTAAKILSDLTGKPLIAFAKPLHDAAIHIWGEASLNHDQKETEQIFGFHAFEWFNNYHVKLMQSVGKRYDLLTEENMGKLMSLRSVFTNPATKKIYETITPRKLMQLYGTEYWRNLQPSIFVDLVRDTHEDCIITDVRFDNEAAICDLLIVIKREGVEPVNNHTSEDLARKFNDFSEMKECLVYNFGDAERCVIVVENNGTIDDLQQKLKEIADFL